MASTRSDEVVTKSYLTQTLHAFGKKLEERITERVEGKVSKRILESEDRIMKELKEMREEFDAHQFSHQRINDEINGHENRITNIEQALPR